MQFYVPTIGDKLYLAKDWTFTLHQERRNQGLAKKLADVGSMKEYQRIYNKVRCIKRYPNSGGGFFNKYTEIGSTLVVEVPSTYFNDLLASGNWEDAGLDHIYKYSLFEWKNSEAQVTLPKGTELTVARIYIKSSYRNYDSITWRITNCPIKSLKRTRFWTKLQDANRIVCELSPIVDTEAPVAKDRFSRILSE